METTYVALVGMGTVGTGVAQLLLDLGDRTARYAGRSLWINHIAVRDVSKRRQADLPQGVITDQLERILHDPQVTLVAHLVGGIEPARSIMLALLENGKDVVTANKALLAEHGPELFDRARHLGRTIAFEAAVAGGIPIIANIAQCLAANKILSLEGILNGTSNFVVTQMDEGAGTYQQSLETAQQRGFAEEDPTLDIDGTDAAQKLAILAHLAFGVTIRWQDIPRRGIQNLNLEDFRLTQALGYRIKLIAYAKLLDFGLQLMVSPMLVKIGTPLAEVRENYNAIRVVGDAVGPVFFHGQGAGAMPTASAVVADMIDTALGRTKITFHNLKLWSDRESPVKVSDVGKLPGRYYLRLVVHEQPDVLAQIAEILGHHHISVASVNLHDVTQPHDAKVSLVIMTRETREASLMAAVSEISKLPFVAAVAERLKVLD